MKNTKSFFTDDLFLPALQATTPPPQDAGGYTRGSRAFPLVPNSSDEVGRWNVVAFFFHLLESFNSLLTGSSDCATLRKAEQPEFLASVKPRVSTLLTDWFDCQCCGDRTRNWIISTPGNKECVCRSCWPAFARARYGISAPLANGADGGEGKLHVSPPRRYFLES